MCIKLQREKVMGLNWSKLMPTSLAACGLCAKSCFAEARQTIGREMTVAEVMAD